MQKLDSGEKTSLAKCDEVNVVIPCFIHFEWINTHVM